MKQKSLAGVVFNYTKAFKALLSYGLELFLVFLLMN
jgi:hypothetical protein